VVFSCFAEVVEDIVGGMDDVDDVGGAGISSDAADETVRRDRAETVQTPGPNENRGVARAGACHAGARAREPAFPRHGGPDI
jgi:hypothetical protein